MRKLALICCLAAVLAGSAVAQTPDRGRGTGDFYIGYTHLSGDVGKNGWDATGTYNWNRYVGAEGNIAGYYGEHFTTYDQCEEPRVLVPCGTEGPIRNAES